jgi:ribulose kinase
MEPLPIAKSDDALRAKVEAAAGRLIQLARQGQVACGDLLDWLRVQHQIEKPSKRLESPTELDSDAFVAEVKKLRGRKKPLSAPAL